MGYSIWKWTNENHVDTGKPHQKSELGLFKRIASPKLQGQKNRKSFRWTQKKKSNFGHSNNYSDVHGRIEKIG